jgi:hypothetical protein
MYLQTHKREVLESIRNGLVEELNALCGGGERLSNVKREGESTDLLDDQALMMDDSNG